jgi:hypothetical protein
MAFAQISVLCVIEFKPLTNDSGRGTLPQMPIELGSLLFLMSPTAESQNG